MLASRCFSLISLILWSTLNQVRLLLTELLGHVSLKVYGPDLHNLVLEGVELSLEVGLLGLHDSELDQLLSDLSHLVRDVADVA